MSHHQSNINRTTATHFVAFSGTALLERLISILYNGGKEIYTTGFEMTTVVSGGDVNSLLENKLMHLPSKIKWVFS